MAVETKERPTETEAGDCFKGNLGWLLYRAHWALAAEMTTALAPLGLSARAYHVLRAALDGEHTQKELADMIGLDKTTMVVTIDELERDGLAERFFFSSRRRHTISVSAFLLNRSSDLKKRSGARPGRPQPLRGTKGKRKGARLWYVGGQQF